MSTGWCNDHRAYYGAHDCAGAAEVGAEYVAGIDGCIAIVKQTIETLRAEDPSGESVTIRIGISAREHVIALLNGYRQQVLSRDQSLVGGQSTAAAADEGDTP